MKKLTAAQSDAMLKARARRIEAQRQAEQQVQPAQVETEEQRKARLAAAFRGL
jgi:hypothetical protein